MQSQVSTIADILQQNSGNRVTEPETGDVIPSIAKRHLRFLLASCLAFAALYTELIYFAASYYNNLSNTTLAELLSGVFVLSFGGYFTAATLPHKIFKSRFNNYSPIIFLTTEWSVSIAITVVTTLLTLGAGIWAVNGDLGAVSEVIRSLALYGLAGCILLHGIILYVRYVRYLYEREMHQSYKIVAIAGVSVIVALALILYLLPFDLGRMGGSGPNAGFLTLHLTIRDVTLVVTTLFILMWHFTCLADH